MDDFTDPFVTEVGDEDAEDVTVNVDGLQNEVAGLLAKYHPAHVIAALFSATVHALSTIDDKALRKGLEWEYFHAYQFWVGINGQVRPEEMMRPPEPGSDDKYQGLIMRCAVQFVPHDAGGGE